MDLFLTARCSFFYHQKSTATREAGGLDFLSAANAAGKKIRKHLSASMLILQSHPVWARIYMISFTSNLRPYRPAAFLKF
jgi:hypothetical protein